METYPMFTNHRVIACPMEDGTCHIEFYNENTHADNSHRCLVSHIERIELTSGVSRDWDMLETFSRYERKIGYFGAFYSLMGGNGCQGILAVYGTSSDYPTLNLDESALLYYHEQFDKYCEKKNYKLLWLI